uniref:PKD domain-containing protein n=1 Tax=Tamlana sp. I1 TaxID=2762061 RepID=UPI00188DD002
STDDEGVVAYHWDFGDGNTDTSANPIHTYINEGNYIVTLTVTDIEGLQGTQQLTIDVAANMPASLVANPESLDFGIQALDGAVTYLDLTLFNNGDAGEDISISAMTISGTDTSLFSIGETFPIDVLAQNSQIIPVSFTPDGSVGSKTAALEITHSGENSPLIIPLDAVLNDPNMLVPLVRISAGSKTVIASTDGGPDWEKNSTNGAYSGTSFSVNTGTSYSGSFLYSNKHSSIPNYIDENTFKGLFNRYRYDAIAAPEMEYSIPVSNGTYTVNLFFGNGYSGTSQVGDRVFDVLIEGKIVQDNLDLIEAFGHQVAGMLSYVVTVNDGVLNIAFGHEVENPLINAIEIIGGAVISNQSPVAIASASDLTGEAPFEVSFTGSNSTDDEGVVAYYWDFGDGNTANTADPVHTYTSEGTYVATLTVTDAEGLQGSKQLTIEVIAVGVNQSPVAIASASNSTGEAPFEVSFTGSNSTDDEGVVAYHWDFGDGNTDTSANPIHTYINAGNYIVTLTVTDIEGLQGTQQLTIDVAANMPASLVANPESLDFGIQALDGAVTYLDLTLFNNGDAGEDISISAMTISGTDTSLFSIGETFPIDVLAQNSQIIPVSFTPDGSVGSKTAALEITHSGENSPLIIPLDAVLNDPNMLVPLVRISAGSKTVIASTDGGPDWEKNSTNGAYSGTSFSVNTGTSYSGSFLYSNKHSSIPNYIDENTFKGLFNRYRYDAIAAPEMEYSIPVSNGTYTVNLFFGNGYSGTSQVGDRVFDVLIEGEIVQDNLDLIEAFGHQVAGMFSYSVTVNDGVLNISFGHEVENPLISAIEIMGQSTSFVSVSKTDSVNSSDSSFSDKSQESKLELNISCSLIPNPASNYTQLIFDNELLEVNAILIYNSNGQLVKSVNDPIKLNFKYDIKLFDLSEGLYFVNIMTSEGVMITKKLMIRY